jgi:hypothetical protein
LAFSGNSPQLIAMKLHAEHSPRKEKPRTLAMNYTSTKTGTASNKFTEAKTERPLKSPSHLEKNRSHDD